MGRFHDCTGARSRLRRISPTISLYEELLTKPAEVPTRILLANYFRVTRDPKNSTMEKTTQVFLGVRMVCTQCHDHPFERWTQNQYYEMTSFFSTVGLRPGFESGEEIVFDKRDDFDVHHPKDDRVMKPKFLVTAATTAKPRSDTFARWRESAAESPGRLDYFEENPFFAKSMSWQPDAGAISWVRGSSILSG